MTYRIAALYLFTPIADCKDMRARLLPSFQAWGICGTLLIAPEGINGTLAGTENTIDSMLDLLGEATGLKREDVKFSDAPDKPFNRLKIRLKRELITFKQPEADLTKRCGNYVEAADWNALIQDPEVTLVDTRNVYETMIGAFDHAEIPPIDKFTDFATYVREKLDPAKNKKIAMYCTGGIRCEKASAFMLAEGFEEVYHLKGGILKYLETVPAEQSLWHGECYVFDRRIAVGHGLTTGDYSMCFYCGYPLSATDTQHALYEEGVSCAHCHDRTDCTHKNQLRLRHKQISQNPGVPDHHLLSR